MKTTDMKKELRKVELFAFAMMLSQKYMDYPKTTKL